MTLLGDMSVVGQQPAKMMKALAVVSAWLHPTFDARPDAKPGTTKDCCILSSLAVRDFLRKIGFADAGVRSVAAIMQAERNGEVLHSLGIGCPAEAYGKVGHKVDPGRWDGHLICTVPPLKLLIDTTIYPTIRPAWADVVHGMIALRYGGYGGVKLYGLKPLAGFEVTDDKGYRFSMAWLDRPGNVSWRQSPDVEPWRRDWVVASMVERFGRWEG